MRYQIIVSIFLVLYSILAVWIKLFYFESLIISPAGIKLLDISLLLIPVASTTGIALGCFFYVLSTVTEEKTSSLNRAQIQLISKIVFWIPPMAPTLSACWAFFL